MTWFALVDNHATTLANNDLIVFTDLLDACLYFHATIVTFSINYFYT